MLVVLMMSGMLTFTPAADLGWNTCAYLAEALDTKQGVVYAECLSSESEAASEWKPEVVTPQSLKRDAEKGNE